MSDELPPVPEPAVIHGRRHRPWLGASGVVLAIAMFLPAMHACDATTYPYELPFFWPPYIFGAAFALVAIAVTRRAFVRAAWILRGALVVYAIAAGILCAYDVGIGAIELPIALVLLALNGVTAPPDERRVAVTAILAGGLQCVWFAPWCLDRSAMSGLYISLLASVGLVVAGALWTSDLPSPPPARPRPAELPRARVIRVARD